VIVAWGDAASYFRAGHFFAFSPISTSRRIAVISLSARGA
jgi:hypothetical protein